MDLNKNTYGAEYDAISDTLPFELRRTLAYARVKAARGGRRYRVWSFIQTYRYPGRPDTLVQRYGCGPFAEGTDRAVGQTGCTLCGLHGWVGIRCAGPFHIRARQEFERDREAASRALKLGDEADLHLKNPLHRVIPCKLRCEVPPNVRETPPARHAWGDVLRCPNDDCDRTFLVLPEEQGVIG